MMDFSRFGTCMFQAWWRQIDWRACAAYSVTGIPGAAMGAGTLLAMPPHIIEGALGAFFIGMIPARRWLALRNLKLRLWHLAMAGFVVVVVKGLLTGSTLMAGAFFAKRFVLQLEPEHFRLLMDGLMLVSGATMLLAAVL